MRTDDLAAVVAERMVAEKKIKDLILRTRELVFELYHEEHLTARRIEEDTIRILTLPPYGFDAADIRGLGLGENSVRRFVGHRT